MLKDPVSNTSPSYRRKNNLEITGWKPDFTDERTKVKFIAGAVNSPYIQRPPEGRLKNPS